MTSNSVTNSDLSCADPCGNRPTACAAKWTPESRWTNLQHLETELAAGERLTAVVRDNWGE